MSYMTPYYFSASAGQAVSIWMRSNDFEPKVGLGVSGSTNLITESFGNAWQYDSLYSCAAIRVELTASVVYKIEATSTSASATGAFQLYVTPAETSSTNMNFGAGVGAITRVVYDNKDDVIVGTARFTGNFPAGPYTSSLAFINPKTALVTVNANYNDCRIYDDFYNPYSQTVWVLATGSVPDVGGFFYEYSGSGALVDSHSISLDLDTSVNALLAFDSASNKVLIVPNDAFGATAQSASIYDCVTKAVVQTILLPSANLRWAAYASSSNAYYIVGTNPAVSGLKIDATTYATTTLANATSSGYGLSYVIEVDRLFFQSPTSTCAVYNPNTDTTVHEIPGVIDFQYAVYDSCAQCVVISDDAAGDPSYAKGGGLSYVSGSTFAPVNFISYYGVWPIVYSPATSTVFATNYYDNTAFSFFSTHPTGSLPQPAYPPSASAPLALPINLMVSSGSAVLDWSISGTLTPDFYNIYRSTTGEAGPYSVITTSLVTHSVDPNVTPVNTYWYKVEGVALGGATSSFSNQAAIDIIPCNKAAFDPVVYTGYISYSSGSTYNNIYGKVLNFTTSVSQSVSIWGRSPDFATMLTLVDATGSILRENQNDGWTPSGDLNVYGGNSALTYNLESGSYGIEISSTDNSIGRFSVIVSPGPKLETTWSPAQETAYVSYISSSGWILVGENGINAVFYNPATGQQKKIAPNAGCQGALYSPIQDKAYLWVYYQTGGQYTSSIDVYDNTGSYLHSNYFFRSPVNTFPNVDFSGYFCYDGKNDRLAFHAYNGFLTTQSFVVWDCATETIIAGPVNMKPFNPTFGDAWESCYSWIDNHYYVALTRESPSYANPKMIKIDAATFAVTNSLTTNSILTSYISQSNLIIGRGGAGSGGTGPSGGPIEFIDPVSDTVIYTSPDLPSQGQLFEGGGAGDKCANTYVLSIDPRSGYGGVTNHACLAVMDRNTYLPLNYLKINDDSPGGFAPSGWFTYNIVSVEADSKTYMAQVDYDTNEGRLYSIIPARAFMPIESPYTSSAADTASCMTFNREFVVTASGVTRATTEHVCSSKTTGSNVMNTMVVSDCELNQFFNGQHNFNNYFLSSSGEYFNNYNATYTHPYSGKNAVFCNEKFYMMSDGLTEQSAMWEPVSGSAMLVFDHTGSLLTTIPLTYGGRDWATDGNEVFVYEMTTPTGSCWIEKIDPTTDTVSSTTQLQVGYITSPGFAFTYPTSSMSASANYAIGEKQFPYFGRIIAFSDANGNTNIYYNSIYGNNIRPNGTQTFLDTGSGDRIWNSGNTGYALYNYDTKLNMGEGSAYSKWCGSAGYCPITDHVYWGAVDTGSNTVVIETDRNLNFVKTHSVSNEIHSIVWNRKNRTMEFYSNEGFSGRMYIFDPVTNTMVCNINTLSSGVYGGGDMGWSVDVNVNTGEVYVPQRYDGASSPATGSIKVYVP